MALIALIRRRALPGGIRAKAVLSALGIFGASLFFGDSMITPAISVLSAVEGVQVAAPSVSNLVIPITVAIIIVLFLVQRMGTGAVGRMFGPVMMRLVHRDRRARRAGHRRPPGDPGGAVAQLRDRLPVRPLRHRVLLPDRRRPGRHRSRGAVRGHGTLRPHAGQARLAAGRLPRLHPELPGPGRPDPGPPGQHQQPVLPAGSGVGQAPDGVPRHHRDRHRVAGGHQRRLLGRAPGRATRLPAAAAHPVHLGTDDGPDLRPVGQLAAAGGRSRPGARIQDLGRAGLRLRHRRDRHDHDHDPAVLLLRPSSVAMAAVDRAGGRRRADRHRPAVLRRQPDQAHPRSVVPAADRHRRLHHLHHLAARPRTRHAAAGPRRRAAPGVHRRNCTP